MNWLKNFLSPTGESSTHLVLAIACFVTAIIYTFTEKPDPVILGTWMASGTALCGVSAVTKT